ncbi:hypothetical protein [Clostridium sp. ZS2-4]|uniref:hypothetical protein n=1 Tax=Clostridium sp. ZS2-4 TaxID=2987703 RepID=UPI00227C255F|nr:hypothetical protein [Clostridium sp. ZS2-4]MCY6354211.1 hypothetical protein [Clostridium sp. ZS2-4]
MKKMNNRMCILIFCLLISISSIGCSSSKQNTSNSNKQNSELKNNAQIQALKKTNSNNDENVKIEEGNKGIKPEVVSNQENKKDNSTQSKEKIISLTDEEHKKINIFFSNFSEVYLKPFQKGKISDSELIQFGFYHNYINNPKRVKYKDSNALISKEYVFESIEKYFKLDISKHKIPESIGIKYSNGYFYMPAADGETYPFSQVTKLIDNGDKTMTAYVDVYVGNIFDFYNYKPYSKWSKNDKDSAHKIGRYKALIEKENERYILLEYNKLS